MGRRRGKGNISWDKASLAIIFLFVCLFYFVSVSGSQILKNELDKSNVQGKQLPV